MSDPREKLIVALDVSRLGEAETLVKVLSPTVGIFKIGKELFTSAGPDAVRMVHAAGARVFLDLKFHDIPNTVGSACEAATRLGVFMLNVHALGGKQMLFQAVQSVHKTAEEIKRQPPLLIGVTVLTSLNDRDLKEVGVGKGLKKEVQSLTALCKVCGLDGVVASGQDLETVRAAAGPDFVVVTPGVRPVWAAHGDQKRIVTPKEAVARGAHYVVVGRPITQHAEPRKAAEKVLEEMF